MPYQVWKERINIRINYTEELKPIYILAIEASQLYMYTLMKELGTEIEYAVRAKKKDKEAGKDKKIEEGKENKEVGEDKKDEEKEKWYKFEK